MVLKLCNFCKRSILFCMCDLNRVNVKSKLFFELIRGRYNKQKVIISGIPDKTEGINLMKLLKNNLKVGGTFKNSKIELQGNCYDQAISIVTSEGYTIQGV